MYLNETEELKDHITAFLAQSRLMPTIPEGFELDDSQINNRAGQEDEEDIDENLPEAQFAGVRRSRHRVFDQRAKEGYYSLPAEMRSEVLRLHRALAHIRAVDLARILRDAGARLEVVEWTKKFFKCPVGEARHKPGLPRISSARHNWEFNKVVGLDHFNHTFKHTQR